MADEKEYQKNCEQALIQCARVCCVCRRFRPSHIQVHHIVERADGGTDDLDNLIPVCIFCHQGHVHARVPFTQRFSPVELKGLRDAAYALVEEGKLVPPDGDADSSFQLDDQRNDVTSEELSNEARELLLEAVKDRHGIVMRSRNSDGLSVLTNSKNMLTEPKDPRCQAKWEGAVEELEQNELIVDHGLTGGVFKMTRRGYEFADLIA